MISKLRQAIAEAEKSLEMGKRSNAYSSEKGRWAYRISLIAGATNIVTEDDGVFQEFDEIKSKFLMQQAGHDDPLAKESIRQIIADYIARKKPLPETLGAYLLKILDCSTSKGKPGKIPHGYHYRDFYIGMAVWHVTQCGFPRTRNVGTRDSRPENYSACSIVADVLASKFGIHLSEDMVKKAAETWRHLDT